MNPEILELTAKIDAVNTTINDFAFVVVGCMFFGILSLAICCLSFNNAASKKRLIFLIIPLILFIIGGFFIMNVTTKQDTIIELIEQRDKIFDIEINAMTCIDLRSLLLESMGQKHNGYIKQKQDWIKDYYFVACETPLRDEVLKLQEVRP